MLRNRRLVHEQSARPKHSPDLGERLLGATHVVTRPEIDHEIEGRVVEWN